MKTANEKASEILGHWKLCDLEALPSRTNVDAEKPYLCTCSHSPEVQVAAIRGTLRREHAFTLGADRYVVGYRCPLCRETRGQGTLQERGHAGPCAPPIDDGEAWRLWLELCRNADAELVFVADGAWYATPGYEFGTQGTVSDPKDAVVRLYIEAHDAGRLVHHLSEADPEDRAEAVERE